MRGIVTDEERAMIREETGWENCSRCDSPFACASNCSCARPTADPDEQQLVARIKRSSKYWGQTAPNAWFDVRVVPDNYYQLRGNNNNYRFSDVVMGVRIGQIVMDFKTGKSTHG